MRRVVVSLAIAWWCGIAVPAQAVDPEPGNWKLIVVGTPQVDTVECIFKLSKDGATWSAELVAPEATKNNASQIIKFQSCTVASGQVTLPIKRGPTSSTVEVTLQDAKHGKGTIGDDRRVNAVKLEWTEDEKLDNKSRMISKTPPEPFKELAEMQIGISRLISKINGTKDADEKKELAKEMVEKQKELETARPDKLRKVIADHADQPAAMDAAIMLLRSAVKNDATEEEGRNWTKIAIKVAGEYGPKYQLQTMLETGEYALQSPKLQKVAADLARDAEKAVGPGGSTAKMARALNTLVYALGSAPEAKPIAARLEALELKLDAEYASKHAFKVEPYAGRKDGGNRIVLLEMFTGAQCPPCVAADIAFDKLPTLYKETDVVALQYHMHVPGPDPMTNADGEARWAYYRKAYPYDPKEQDKPAARGVPCALFNGQLDEDRKHQGGGGESAAPTLLKEFRSIIEPALDEKSDAAIQLTATKSGDVVTVNAKVSGVDANSSRKLRFVLVEDSIRYLGGNGIRFHHHVVRAMPGGADGLELGAPNEVRQASVNLTELRGKLTSYLDEFVVKRGPFPKPNRPLDFKNLKAIAWIQDDEADNRAVLQAAMVDVK